MAYRTIPKLLSANEYEERLVNRWGETVDRVTAAEMLGVTRETIRRYINAGYFQTTPNGRVIVREAARWIKSNPRIELRKKQ